MTWLWIFSPTSLTIETCKNEAQSSWEVATAAWVGVTRLFYKEDLSKRVRNLKCSIPFLSWIMASLTTSLSSTIKYHMGRCVSSLELLQLRASGCYHLWQQVRFNRSLFDRFNVQQLLGKIYPKGLKMNKFACLQRGVKYLPIVFSRL